MKNYIIQTLFLWAVDFLKKICFLVNESVCLLFPVKDTAAWQDPELLRDIEGATGLDLGSTSSGRTGQKGKGGKGKGSGKKGKGKAKKYPGLTDIRKINKTSRNRLEKIVMNR